MNIILSLITDKVSDLDIGVGPRSPYLICLIVS